MRRIFIVVLLAVGLLPAAAFAQAATTTPSLTVTAVPLGPVFTETLSEGSTGPDVMRLQQYLNTHGCPLAQSGPGSYQNETNYFGPLTKAALECFQKDTGVIPVTGNLGTLTRRYISTLP